MQKPELGGRYAASLEPTPPAEPPRLIAPGTHAKRFLTCLAARYRGTGRDPAVPYTGRFSPCAGKTAAHRLDGG